MKFLRYIIFFIIIFNGLNFTSFAQNTKEIVNSMSVKDKLWAVKNYSSLKKAKKISLNVLCVMDSLNKENFLGGNKEGGVFDAFRHIYWMYCLSTEIGEEKARRVGEIYEKYNKYLFEKKNVLGYDSVGMVMDLFNNELGISLYKKQISDSLIFNEIVNVIHLGKAKIVKKNTLQESLDINNNIIPEKIWKKYWVNDRILVNSNYIHIDNK